MKFLEFSLAALLAAPAALAVPAKRGQSFSVPVTHVKRQSADGVHRRGTGKDSIRYVTYWLAPAKAGGQDVSMLVDTGSSDLWIIGPDAPQQQQQGQKIYNPHRSQSSHLLQGEHFKISYGTGDNGVSGPVYTDHFAVGSAKVQKMAIGSAKTLQGISPGSLHSGIMGLGFKGGNSVRPDQQSTFMETLQSQLDQPIFACNFKINGGGDITFGKVDHSKYTGQLQKIPAVNGANGPYPYSWSTTNVKYVSNGRQLGTFDLVFDTGGPSASGPLSVVKAYYQHVQGAHDVNGDGSVWSVPCNTQMPDLEYHFSNGAVGKIPGKNMIEDFGNGQCQGWLVKENSDDRGVVGDAFFNSNVVVFNQKAATISFAPQA